MALLIRRLMITATVLALSGSQAVLSACLALCLGSMPAAAVPHHGSTETEPVIAAPVARHHGHHASPSSPPQVTEAAFPASDEDAAPRRTALGASCCSDTDVVLVARSRTERVDAIALASAFTARSWQLLPRVGRAVPWLGTQVSPAPPVGAPIPLRI